MEMECDSRNKTSHFKKKKRKNKLVISFDENARREFLTGFRKRNLQKKNKALEEFEKLLKLERKRIKSEAKMTFQKLLMSQRTIPALEDLNCEEIDMGTHCVQIRELSAADLAKSENRIGMNQVQYEEPEKEIESNKSNKQFVLEGMELETIGNEKLRNCKNIKKLIKQQATHNVKNSKIFQKKSKIERIQHIKRKKKQEKKRKKLKKLKNQQ